MASEAQVLKDAFSQVLTDVNSTVSRKQLCSIIRNLDPGMTEEGLNNLFDYVDKNGNGLIEYNEFIDFICEMDEDAMMEQQPSRAELNKSTTVSLKDIQSSGKEGVVKMFDTERWKMALNGGAWAFASDSQASAMRMIVNQFPSLPPVSPEGLTLAEEFVLLWHDRETGELPEYSYFGSDEPFHNALFGACLIGLQARGCVSFVKKKCKYMGTFYELALSGSAPKDSAVLQATYKELASKEDMSLKLWFDEKSGKWGQDETTKLALKELVDRGILEAGGLMGDAFNNAKFKLKDTAKEAALMKRLQDVVNGKVEADGRSVALLALCRTADRRDPKTNILMKAIFGSNADAMTKKVDALVESIVTFSGLGAEEINKMIDILPGEVQQLLASNEFKQDAQQQFQELSGGKGKISPAQLAKKLDTGINALVKEKLGIGSSGMGAVIAMFDADQDGNMDVESFTGFLMWCHALQCFVRE